MNQHGYSLLQVAPFHSIPRLKHQALGSVFAKITFIIVLEDAEGLRWVVRPHNLGRVEDIAQFVAGETVEAGVAGIQLGA